jgi:ATP-dependent DNA helicase RecG
MNIEQLIKQGESEKLEFKENFDRETIETVGAFSNTKGGIILIGISDKGVCKGITAGKNTIKKWLNEIFQATEPAVIPEIRIEKFRNKSIGVIEVKEFPLKPVSVKGKCFKRVGNANKVLTPKEISDFYLHSTGSSWDALICPQATLEDIDIKKVERYIEVANSTGRRKFKEKPIEALRKVKLIKDNKPTWACMLLFAKEPPLPQAKVHCGRFKAPSIIIDDNYIEGDLISQVDEVMSAIQKNISVRYEITGIRRKEIWDYPIPALRESVLNAICHRDYRENAEITIKIFDDYISIWNPGGLPIGTTLEDLFDPSHPSNPRNRLIAQVFYDIGEIEGYGTGIQRIINACKEAGLPIPEFKEVFGGFQVIFRKDIYTEEYLKSLGLNERQIKAVMYVKEKGSISNQIYTEINNTTKRTASRDLTLLVSKGIFKKEGVTGKGTLYFLRSQIEDKGDIKGT